MNNNLNILGLKDVTIEKIEEVGKRIALYVILPTKHHPCPTRGMKTEKIHDYRNKK